MLKVHNMLLRYPSEFNVAQHLKIPAFPSHVVAHLYKSKPFSPGIIKKLTSLAVENLKGHPLVDSICYDVLPSKYRLTIINVIHLI